MHMSAGTARGEGKGGSGVWCWRRERQWRSVGRAPGGVEHGRWERHAGGVVGSARARCGSGGRAPGQAVPGRCGPHQRSAPSPRRHTADRNVFKLSGWRRRQACVGSSAAARAVSAAMPSTPARADTPLAMAWWPRDLGGCAPCQAGGMALGGGPVGAGGRGWPPDPAQPTPASRRHAVRAPPRHGSWPSCTPCPAAGRAGGAGLGDGDLGWQALAGGRRTWWRRDGAGAGQDGGGRLARTVGRGDWAGGAWAPPASRAPYRATNSPRPQPESGRGSEHIYCPRMHFRTGRRAHGASAPSGGGDWPGAVGGASSGARRVQDGVAFCGILWHFVALGIEWHGIGWHWMALD